MHRRRKQPTTRAFTLVEVVLTILIVGVGLVASVRAMLPYEDPDGSIKFGPEDNEAPNPTTRADFDDIDDYDGWTASPPQKKDGQTEPDCASYTRSVIVQSTDHDDFNNIDGDDASKPKRITITVSRTGTAPIVITTVRLRGSNREDLE